MKSKYTNNVVSDEARKRDLMQEIRLRASLEAAHRIAQDTNAAVLCTLNIEDIPRHLWAEFGIKEDDTGTGHAVPIVIKE